MNMQHSSRTSVCRKKGLFTTFEWVSSSICALVLVAVFLSMSFRVVNVQGDSMLNTLYSGDRLLLTGAFYEPEYGDVVVIERKDDTPLIKRVIGLEGDRIRIDKEGGTVYRNGQPLDEPYVRGGFTTTFGMTEEIIVPEGHLFVMGDNRAESLDSRSLGALSMENLVGKVLIRIGPKFGRIGE